MKEKTIKDLLPPVLTEALGEDKLNVLQAEFTRLVEAKVQERVELAKDCQRVALDEEAKQKLERLIVKIDEVHKAEFMKAYNVIVEDCANEIDKVKRYYKESVKKESNKFKKQLIESIGKMIKEQVSKVVPFKAIKKAVKNTTAVSVLESMKQLLAIDKAAALETCRKPFMESVKVMDRQGKKLRMLSEENANLRKQIVESEKDTFYAERQKTLHLNEDALNFVKRTIGSASLDYIKENFSYALEQYKKLQNREKEALTKKTMNERRSTRTQVARAQLVESKKKPVAKKIKEEPMSLHESLASNIIGEILG